MPRARHAVDHAAPREVGIAGVVTQPLQPTVAHHMGAANLRLTRVDAARPAMSFVAAGRGRVRARDGTEGSQE